MVVLIMKEGEKIAERTELHIHCPLEGRARGSMRRVGIKGHDRRGLKR